MQTKGVQILNFMGSSNQRVLVHQEMDEIELKGSVDVVLTPQFYTFLKEALEIKFAYQAKNIAPAFFDDYLSLEVEHQYHVYKHGGEWYFFAYSIDEITLFLEEKGLSSSQIGKIYFAQELEKRLIEPIKLGDTMAMKTVDNTVTLLPQQLVAKSVEYQLLNLEKESFKHSVTIGGSYDSFIPLKETVFLTTLLLLLGASFLFEGSRGRDSIGGLEMSRTELLEQYPKLSSSFQRDSAFQKYEKIDKEERAKREVLMQISKMISPKNRLKSLVLDDSKVVATIMLDSRQAINKVKKILKEKEFKVLNENTKEISVEKKL